MLTDEWSQHLRTADFDDLPYKVHVVSPLERYHTVQICHYCKKSECKGCDLPNDDSTVAQFMQQRIMGEFGKYSNNNIFYTEHGFTNRVDFELEVIYDE